MKLLVALMVLGIGAILLGYAAPGDQRMVLVTVLGWVTLFIATVAAGLMQLYQATRRD